MAERKILPLVACVFFILLSSGCSTVPRHPDEENPPSLLLDGPPGPDSVADDLQDGVMLDNGDFVRSAPNLPDCKSVGDCPENYCKLNDRIEFTCVKKKCHYKQTPCPAGTVCTETETDSALDDLEGRTVKLACVPKATTTTSTTTTSSTHTTTTLGDLGPCGHANMGLFSPADACWMCSRHDALDSSDSYYFWLYIQREPDCPPIKDIIRR
jgi:hypothetical protein